MRLTPLMVASVTGALFGVVSVNTVVRAEAAPRSVTVRIYDGIGVPRPSLSAATQTTRSIFSDVGIGMTWRFCRSPQLSFRPSDACGEPLQPAEFSVRLVEAHRSAEPGSFGYSYVDTAQRAGVLSTLFIDRIFAAAARIRGDRGVLLGRVMAHELGHLLLGTTTHEPRGLMRGLWRDQALKGTDPEDWLFSRADVIQISQTLMARVSEEAASEVASAASHADR